MEKRKTIFDYISEILLIYGFTMLTMLIFCKLFGADAKEVSEMFRLGDEGLAVEVMAQYFLLSTLIVLERYLFFNDKVAKKISVVCSCICMLSSVVITIAIFVYLFAWFPIDMWQPWAMFILCLGICFVVSTLIMNIKLKMDNKKMDEALIRLRSQWENEEDDLYEK